MYRKCKICSFITEESEVNFLSCIKCGNTDEDKLVKYPIEAASSFLDKIYANIHDLEDINVQIDLYNFEGFETTSLFLCATYEVLIERLIFDTLTSINTPNHVSELLLNSNQGQEKMGKLFATLVGSGKTMKAVLKHIDKEEFYEKLHKIIINRNSYIHGNYRAFKDSNLEAEDLKFVADSIIDVFVKLNNTFVYKKL